MKKFLFIAIMLFPLVSNAQLVHPLNCPSDAKEKIVKCANSEEFATVEFGTNSVTVSCNGVEKENIKIPKGYNPVASEGIGVAKICFYKKG